MTGFAADWLALRAPADDRARNPEVAQTLSAAFAGRTHLTVLDLGAGTGNNMAGTAPLLSGRQTWRLAERDAELLARARVPDGVDGEIVPLPVDLGDGVGMLMDPVPDLVTASAFFDLAGASWIDGLVAVLGSLRVPLYAVLTYTGEEFWEPDHPSDAAVRTAFFADQHRDKGLGPALGPEAHGHLETALRHEGFLAIEGQSDWRLTAERDGALIAELAEGIGRATEPALGPEAVEWAEARKSAERVRIGHRDLLALPPC